MLTKYINPVGKVKEADLSVEQVEALKEKGVKVLASEAFSMKDTFKRTRIHVGESVCNGCEG
jgi:hypothetical protein